METYPVILDGTETGTLSVQREGGWTVFDLRCAAAPGIVRVSVYGGGREGYLGVLAPEGDALVLRRRFSRSALRDFPTEIAYAARAGQPCAAPPEEPAENRTAPEPEKPPAEQEPETSPAEPEPEAGKKPDAAPPPEPEAPPEAEKTEAPPDKAQTEAPPALEDVYWYASPDGALVCFDGQHNLIALPEGDARIPDGPGGWPRSIEGKNYVVYRTRDGRLLR